MKRWLLFLLLLVFPGFALAQADPARGGAVRAAICGALSCAHPS